MSARWRSEKALGPDHPDIALSLNNLGYLLQAQGDSPARGRSYERALAICEKALGPDHPDTARASTTSPLCFRPRATSRARRRFSNARWRSRRRRSDREHPMDSY